MRCLFPLLLTAGVALGTEAPIPQLGDRVPQKAVQFHSQEIMTSPGQLRRYCLFDSGAANWDLGVSEAGRITYVSTKDPRFHTPEEISVGMRYSNVRKRCGRAAYAIRGFAWVVSTSSGWQVAFVRGRGSTGKPLLNSTRVSFIYRSSDGA